MGLNNNRSKVADRNKKFNIGRLEGRRAKEKWYNTINT